MYAVSLFAAECVFALQALRQNLPSEKKVFAIRALYHCGMIAFAEFTIAARAVYAAFASATAVVATGRKPRLRAVALSSLVFAAYEGTQLYFAPDASFLLAAAALLTSALALCGKCGFCRFAATASLMGAILILCLCFDNALAELAAGLYPWLLPVVAFGCAVAFVAARAAFVRLYRSRRKKTYSASVSVRVGGECAECAGYWDSGNTLLFRGESPVVVLGRDAAHILDAARVAGRVSVASVCGNCDRVAYYIDELKVKDADGELNLTDVVAVGSDRGFDGFSVLLNCGLHC